MVAVAYGFPMSRQLALGGHTKPSLGQMSPPPLVVRHVPAASAVAAVAIIVAVTPTLPVQLEQLRGILLFFGFYLAVVFEPFVKITQKVMFIKDVSKHIAHGHILLF
jgi:hypothetical protein